MLGTRSLAYVLENMTNLVIKEVHGSGGYGLLVGPTTNKRELAKAFEKNYKRQPGNYIAQPTLSLSTVPVLTRKGLAPPSRRPMAARFDVPEQDWAFESLHRSH